MKWYQKNSIADAVLDIAITVVSFVGIALVLKPYGARRGEAVRAFLARSRGWLFSDKCRM